MLMVMMMLIWCCKYIIREIRDKSLLISWVDLVCVICYCSQFISIYIPDLFFCVLYCSRLLYWLGCCEFRFCFVLSLYLFCFVFWFLSVFGLLSFPCNFACTPCLLGWLHILKIRLSIIILLLILLLFYLYHA